MTRVSTMTQLPYLQPLERLSLNSFSNFMIWSRYSGSCEANRFLMVERSSLTPVMQFKAIGPSNPQTESKDERN